MNKFIIIFCTFFFSTSVFSQSKTKGKVLQFEKSCSVGDTVNIAATGDILMHLVLQVQAHRYNGYNHMWSELAPLFDQMDIVYGNLESPIAPGHFLSSGIPNDRAFYSNADYQALLKKGYSNYPRFNAGPELLEALREHFDVLSTANNHTFDRNEEGVDATIEHLEDNGFSYKRDGDPWSGDYTGTVRVNETRPIWHAEIVRNNMRIAFLGCTYHTNGIRENNRSQVLRCLQPGSKQVMSSELKREVKTLSKEYDALIVTPHWGAEYTPKVDSQRRALSKQIFENGALAVLGAHPHVIQKWEKFDSLTDSNGKTKDRFVIYSLGNFFANQGKGSSSRRDVVQRTSIVLTLGLVKDRNGEVYIQGARYYPYYMSTGNTAVLSRKRRSIVPLNSPLKTKNRDLEKHMDEADRYIDEILPRSQRIEDIYSNQVNDYCER